MIRNAFGWSLAAITCVACNHRAPAPPSAPASGPPALHQIAAPSRLVWKLPAGWEQVEAGEMRLASFTAKGADGQADVGILAFPGEAGGDLPNVNRWREQVGLPPVTQPDLAKLAERVDIAGQNGRLYEQAGQNPSANERSRILAGVLNYAGTAWFFKMNGDDIFVGAQKPVFLGFLKSLRFQAQEAH